MGPDLFGIIWATGFLFAVVGVFALLDRLICGAWSALCGSPGVGLVAGMAAWGEAGGPDERRRSASGGGPSPEPPEPIDPTGPVPTERVRTPRVAPRSGGSLALAW